MVSARGFSHGDLRLDHLSPKHLQNRVITYDKWRERRKSVVGHLRGKLNGVLWWLMGVLLVICTPDDQTSKSKEVKVPQHTARKEGKIKGCGEFSRSCDCLMTCESSIRPSGELKNVEFRVTLAVTISSLWGLTWTGLQIFVNCQEEVLSDNLENNLEFYCLSSVTKPCEPTGPIKFVGLKGLLGFVFSARIFAGIFCKFLLELLIISEPVGNELSSKKPEDFVHKGGKSAGIKGSNAPKCIVKSNNSSSLGK